MTAADAIAIALAMWLGLNAGIFGAIMVAVYVDEWRIRRDCKRMWRVIERELIA